MQKLLRLSPPIALSLAHPDFFSRILQKLQSSKAVVRLNLLRIVRSICDASDEQGGLINRYGLVDTIQRLAEVDGAVLVRNMAEELVKSSESNDKLGMSGGKRRPGRRSSSSTTPPSSSASRSMPPTPTGHRSMHSTAYFLDREIRPKSSINGPIAFRPASRDGSSMTSMINGSGAAAKSRLPRTTSTRPARQSMQSLPKKDENIMPALPRQEASPMPAPNSRRRRQVSSEG